MANLAKTNAALLYYWDNILEFLLEENEAFARYVIYLFDHNKISVTEWLDIEKFEINRNSLINFKPNICSLSTDFFIRYLSNLNRRKADILIDLLENFKQFFIDKLKNAYRKKYCEMRVIFFDENGEKFPIQNLLVQTNYKKYEDETGNIYKNNDFLSDFPPKLTRCLFFGEAGVGKTCHFRKIIYDWCNNENIFKNSILIPLNIKQVKFSQFEVEIWRQIFDKEPTEVEITILQAILTSNDGANIYLFDQVDEYSTVCKKIVDILFGRDSSKFSLIAWGRKMKLNELDHSFNLLYELNKFIEKDILKYFTIYFTYEESNIEISKRKRTSQASELFQFLKENRSRLLSFCSNPFISMLSAILWNNDKENAFEDIFNLMDLLIHVCLKDTITNEGKILLSNLYTSLDDQKTNKQLVREKIFNELKSLGLQFDSSSSYYDYKRRKRIGKSFANEISMEECLTIEMLKFYSS